MGGWLATDAKAKAKQEARFEKAAQDELSNRRKMHNLRSTL